MHLRHVKQSIVTGVICGWNTKREDAHLLADELSRINPGLEVIFSASLERGQVFLSR